MRTEKKYALLYTRQYRRDYRRLARSGRYNMKKLDDVLTLLQNGRALPARLCNHQLKGELHRCEECHIEGDWLLIYERRDGVCVLIAQRTGTHSDLFDA